ncbi:MAG: GntR family transcriptional regulator [Clostridia bacterium]|nr:GntR family transcriptional regulator [Clostridia bacterium]
MQKHSSRYTEIAIDIATMIINGELCEGEKISGRSTLASKYGVSSETIRRSVILLRDSGVVDSAPKSGIKILSSKKALQFITQYQDKASFLESKNEILDIIKAQHDLQKALSEKVNNLLDQLNTRRDLGIICPYEVNIPQGSIIIRQTICQSKFWDNTGATIVSIKRDGNTYLSPGPNWVFNVDDTIVFVGKKDSYTRVVDFVIFQHQ